MFGGRDGGWYEGRNLVSSLVSGLVSSLVSSLVGNRRDGRKELVL